MSHWQEIARSWAFAYGGPVATAGFKSRPQHFKVTEVLSFQPSGEGEFALLEIEKNSINTDEAARRIASFCRLHRSAVAHAGLKDKHGICRQFLSLHLPGQKSPDFSTLSDDQLRVLSSSRHNKKLRPAAIAANRFEIVLDRFEGDRDETEQRLTVIRKQGVPNYFGPQRFGRAFGNLETALKMAESPRRRTSRMQRSMALSAARSWIFNQIVSARVAQATWNTAIEGEIWMLANGNSIFGPEPLNEELLNRVEQQEIDPTGVLWGKGSSKAEQAAAELEHSVAGNDQALCELLVKAGLKQERRRLRLRCIDLEWSWLSDDQLMLKFALPKGCFATSVMRELVRSC